MGTIRVITKRDGSVMHHAEIRLRGHPPQRQSFRTKTQAKKWIQDTESSIAALRKSRISGGVQSLRTMLPKLSSQLDTNPLCAVVISMGICC